jgi:aminopeptidase N
MNKLSWLLLPLGALGLLTAVARAKADDADAVECAKSSRFFAPPDSPDPLRYAPDREVEVLHLALDITPDFKQRTLKGTAALRFRPLVNPVDEIKLDAVELNIDSVTASEKIQGYQTTADQLIITFAEPIPAGREAGVTVAYHVEPTQGIYFRTPEMGYKPGDTHLFSQGEQVEARHWYPCFDSPNEKFTSEVTCRVPDGMTAISNGRLVSRDRDPATGLTVFHWSQEQPHANYLITLVAGCFEKIEDRHNNVALAFFTPPSEINEAPNSFRDTKDIMEFFEEEIGVPFPWPKYYQICVNDFVAGGMENTSATTLTDRTLFTGATENIHTSEALVAHEMAHQWFGDLVTCKDWSHIWLNEGFATYYQILYDGHKHGRDSMLYSLYGAARQVLPAVNDTNSMVRRAYDDPGEMFNYLTYPKGAWVLHMLRSELGSDLYRRCIRTYLERHRYGNVTTEDLRAVIEELSGRPYDQFFDQWAYHAHYPELEAGYTWNEKTKLAKLTIRQTQALSDRVLLFNVPLTVRFKGKFGTQDRAVRVKNKQEDFYFPLESAPEIVRLDPDYTLLAKITFNLPGPMLSAQLADRSDVIGRLGAVAQLADKRDKESVAELRQTLDNDPFFGVRVEASKALRSIHTDEALEALLASTRQPDARVRGRVVMDIGAFYRDTAFESARHTLEQEKNPAILAPALAAIAGYARPEVQDTVLKFLNSHSYRNELADAAIDAMRSQDDPVFVGPLEETLRKREADFTSGGLAQGLGTLGYLARNEEKRDGVEEFLTGYMNDKRRNVRRGAIRALDALGDPKAIAILEKLASASTSSPEQAAAEQAVAGLRAGRKPSDDFKNLRQEVEDLERRNRDLRRDLDELKKEVEARKVAGAQSAATPRRLSPKGQ